MLFLLIGALCISIAPIIVKYVELGPSFIGLFRSFFGAIFLSGYLYRDRKILLRELKKPEISKWLIIAGAIFYLDLFVWHKSIHLIGAGKATVLANTQVFYLMLLGVFFNHEKIDTHRILGALVAIVGIFFLIWNKDSLAVGTNYLEGTFLGLFTGLCYATYIFSLSKLAQKNLKGRGLSPPAKLAIISYITSIFFLPSSLVEGSFHLPTMKNFLLLLTLALVTHALGWLAIKKGLEFVSASTGGLILLLQPVLATVFGIILFGEYLTPMQVGGLTLAVLGIGLGSIISRREYHQLP